MLTSQSPASNLTTLRHNFLMSQQHAENPRNISLALYSHAPIRRRALRTNAALHTWHLTSPKAFVGAALFVQHPVCAIPELVRPCDLIIGHSISPLKPGGARQHVLHHGSMAQDNSLTFVSCVVLVGSPQLTSTAARSAHIAAPSPPPEHRRTTRRHPPLATGGRHAQGTGNAPAYPRPRKRSASRLDLRDLQDIGVEAAEEDGRAPRPYPRKRSAPRLDLRDLHDIGVGAAEEDGRAPRPYPRKRSAPRFDLRDLQDIGVGVAEEDGRAAGHGPREWHARLLQARGQRRHALHTWPHTSAVPERSRHHGMHA